MRRHDPFDKQSAAFSVALHVVLLLIAWASTLYEPPEIEFITYEIELVSPPPTEQAQEEAPAVEEMTVETPDPTPPEPPEPEPEEEVTVEQDDPPPPEPEPEPVTEITDDPTPATTTEEPPEDAVESGEDINIRIEGVRRDYPAYYNTILRQIRACFRPPREGNWETTILFFIERDGTVTDMDFVSRSGNFEFDFAAMGAVECAGRGRLGPLPEDFPFDRLPVRFDFRPNRELVPIFPLVGSRPAVATIQQPSHQQ